MNVAIATTIKNELPLIGNNIDYHRFLGVDTFYVFDDGGTDGSIERIRDQPGVRILPRPALPAAGEGTSTEDLEADHAHRQLANMREALRLGQRERVDWIIFLDPDELVFVDFDRQNQGALSAFFRSLPRSARLVQLPVYEAAQRDRGYQNVFEEETLFKSLFFRRGSRILMSDLRYRVYDPFLEAEWVQSGYHGHTRGKCAVRPDSGLQPAGLHRWKNVALGDPGVLRPEDLQRMAGILHYHCYQEDDFARRYRHNFLSTDMNRVQRKPSKLLWARMARSSEFSDEDLRRYYREWIQLSDESLACFLGSAANLGLLRIAAAQDVFRRGLARRGTSARSDTLQVPQPPAGLLPLGSDELLWSHLEAVRWLPS